MESSPGREGDQYSCFKRQYLILVVGLGLGLIASPSLNARALDISSEFGLGRPASEAQIRDWNIEVTPSGDDLPPGRGTANEGADVYAAKCASCHGETGVEGPRNRLVWGQGTLDTAHPIKTVGSYWPYATTLYDYINRAMPLTAPQSLNPNEVYAVTAWILFRNGVIPKETVLSKKTLPLVRMPNRLGFVPDPRPDVSPP